MQHFCYKANVPVLSAMYLLEKERPELMNERRSISKKEYDNVQNYLDCEGKCNKLQRPVDCEDLYNHGYKSNGVYKIYPDGKIGFDVYCDMKTDGGGWTVIQKRYNGNDKIHLLTKSNLYRLRVDLEDFKGVHKYASYSKFYVGDSLTFHNGHKFATKDHDNKHNCAKGCKGAWWYNNCHYSNLNGLYIMKNTVDAKAMVWYYFHGKYLPLKSRTSRGTKRADSKSGWVGGHNVINEVNYDKEDSLTNIYNWSFKKEKTTPFVVEMPNMLLTSRYFHNLYVLLKVYCDT
ncbi:hypothetical protein KUTeg_015808 [Tegillarca granosa]|uniref:Fibrinogen C-terminal domain-containing protein n=1 Tax=Tegillarca granosa TaxID=220873 RepID=A0ABQ9EPS7_TEGGR|nr:hypothetical protein KUTeg_015808 [Tegillarca granosa]